MSGSGAVDEHGSLVNDAGLEELLGTYVAGTVTDAEAALVQSLATLRSDVAGLIAMLEEAAGAELDALAPSALCDHDASRAAALARIDVLAGEAAPASIAVAMGAAPADDSEAIVLPEALRRYLGIDGDVIPWRRRMGGFAELRVRGGEQTVRLLKIPPGQAMPDHGHGGRELTLVLSGSFSDETGHYGPGDLQIADDTLEHQPVAGGDEPCICFTVVDAPLRFTGLAARLIAPIVDR